MLNAELRPYTSTEVGGSELIKLLLVALVMVVAFVACEFAGAVLQNRAQALHAVEESANPAVAVTPPSLVPQTPD